MKQLEYWNEMAGEAWAENAVAMEPINAVSGEHALGVAAAAAGEVVLDVGCGTGATTFALGRQVGSLGFVMGVDLSAPMVAEARRQQASLGLPWVEFVEDAVESVALPPASVDLVFSRMCLMLVDDVAGALTNLRQALKPGGRLVATSFRGAEENAWLPLVVMGAAAYVDELPPLPLPGEPGPFRFADPAVPRELLEAAGFEDVEITAVDTEVTLDGDPEEVAGVLIQLGPAGGPYRRASAHRQQLARTSVASFLEPCTHDGRLTLPNATWTISARRPA